jgi:hypothetical protein
VHRLQTPELQHDEEPPQEFRTARVQQVLPVLPEAHGASGEQVGSQKREDRSDGKVEISKDELQSLCLLNLLASVFQLLDSRRIGQ